MFWGGWVEEGTDLVQGVLGWVGRRVNRFSSGCFGWVGRRGNRFNSGCFGVGG